MMNGEITNHRKLHFEFVDRIDAVVIIVGLVLNLILIILGSQGFISVTENFLIAEISVIIGAVIVYGRIHLKKMKKIIEDLEDTIEKDINKIIRIHGNTAKLLRGIISKITDEELNPDNIKRGIKRLNGVKQILETDMVQLTQTRSASESIEKCRSSFSAVSTLAIAECLEPAFFEYFVAQICKCAEMNDKVKNGLNMNFSAERYFVYDPDVIALYGEELAIFERLHKKGGIKFNLLYANIVRSRASDALNKLDKRDKELLEKENNPFSWPRSNEGYIPDFMIIDEQDVFGRDQNGELITVNAEDISYYNALVNFFREVSKPEYRAHAYPS